MQKAGDEYRRCASVVLLRPAPDGERFQVLLVHKPRKKDAWQLPQGGAEGEETIEQAALRELKEEAGVSAEVVGSSEQRYQYDFPASYRRFRPDHICGQCIHFVFARTEGDAQVHVDEDEIDSYTWVLPEQLPQYIKRKEYREIVEGLIEEGKGLLHGR